MTRSGLPALFRREKSPNHQKDDRADDGSDQPCPFASLIPADGLAKVGGGKRPDDAEDGRQDEALRFVGTGMDEFGDDPGNETNDYGPEVVPHGAVLFCGAGSGEPIVWRKNSAGNLRLFTNFVRSLIFAFTQ